jgi:uncharacterized protein YjbJ (UPF0337 family)
MDATTDILQGRWSQVKGVVKLQWSKLTDDDLASLSGKQAELVGALQRRYGYGKAQAEMEIHKWLGQRDTERQA